MGGGVTALASLFAGVASPSDELRERAGGPVFRSGRTGRPVGPRVLPKGGDVIVSLTMKPTILAIERICLSEVTTSTSLSSSRPREYSKRQLTRDLNCVDG